MSVLCYFRTLRTNLLLATLLLAVALPSARVHGYAQVPTTNTPYTFHVYEDLVQLPTLVLNSHQQSYLGLSNGEFTLRVDSGPPFHPRSSRREGEEPLELAFACDLSDPATVSIAASIAKAQEQLFTLGLTNRDRVSVFAFDCSLVRSGSMPGFSPVSLRQEMQAALSSSDLHGQEHPGQPCSLRHRMWDVLATVISKMEPLPYRRVLYVFTHGEEGGDHTSWSTLVQYAGSRNVTLMGLLADPTTGQREKRLSKYAGAVHSDEDLFALLCGETGGTVLPISDGTAVEQLTRATQLLRSRYILEFARPRNGTAGLHQITVVTARRHLDVRPSSIAFPVADPSVLSAPNVLPSDPSRAPEQGARRILSPPG